MLNNCPFCDSKEISMCGDYDQFFIECLECEAYGPSGSTKTSAIEKWNINNTEEVIYFFSVERISDNGSKVLVENIIICNEIKTMGDYDNLIEIIKDKVGTYNFTIISLNRI